MFNTSLSYNIQNIPIPVNADTQVKVFPRRRSSLNSYEKTMELCLCGRCANAFYNLPDHVIGNGRGDMIVEGAHQGEYQEGVNLLHGCVFDHVSACFLRDSRERRFLQRQGWSPQARLRLPVRAWFPARMRKHRLLAQILFRPLRFPPGCQMCLHLNTLSA